MNCRLFLNNFLFSQSKGCSLFKNQQIYPPITIPTETPHFWSLCVHIVITPSKLLPLFITFQLGVSSLLSQCRFLGSRHWTSAYFEIPCLNRNQHTDGNLVFQWFSTLNTHQNHLQMLGFYFPSQRFTKCDPQTSSISITWELLRNATYQALPTTNTIRNSGA